MGSAGDPLKKFCLQTGASANGLGAFVHLPALPDRADTWADQGGPELPAHTPRLTPGSREMGWIQRQGLGWETVSPTDLTWKHKCACVVSPKGGAVSQEGAGPCSERSCAVTAGQAVLPGSAVGNLNPPRWPGGSGPKLGSAG